jgi:hypothetical protein
MIDLTSLKSFVDASKHSSMEDFEKMFFLENLEKFMTNINGDRQRLIFYVNDIFQAFIEIKPDEMTYTEKNIMNELLLVINNNNFHCNEKFFKLLESLFDLAIQNKTGEFIGNLIECFNINCLQMVERFDVWYELFSKFYKEKDLFNIVNFKLESFLSILRFFHAIKCNNEDEFQNKFNKTILFSSIKELWSQIGFHADISQYTYYYAQILSILFDLKLLNTALFKQLIKLDVLFERLR